MHEHDNRDDIDNLDTVDNLDNLETVAIAIIERTFHLFLSRAYFHSIIFKILNPVIPSPPFSDIGMIIFHVGIRFFFKERMKRG